MQYQANAQEYLAAEVFTAPPQKLQLMLIEMAIRQIARTKREWLAGETGQACMSLLHARQIADQLIAGVNREVNPDLADRVLAVYGFIARRLQEAGAERDEKKLDSVARILEIERDTWRTVCEKLGGKIDTEATEPFPADTPRVPPAPTFGSRDGVSDLSTVGFSLEA